MKYSRRSHLIDHKDVIDVFKQMLADKKAVKAYICEHGTLKGFENEGYSNFQVETWS